MTKRCPCCKRTLPADAFRPVKTRPHGLSAYCRECLRKKDKERYADPEKRAKTLASVKAAYQRNRPHKLKQAKKYRRDLRMAALTAYSGDPPNCACCGESHVEFLEIDHVDGDGAKHRAAIGSSIQVLSWLRRNDYPPGFQVLCRNCNQARWAYGQCPHEREAAQAAA